MEQITTEMLLAFMLGVVLSRWIVDMIFGPWWRH